MKDTIFSKNRTINCGGKLLDLSTPQVMGIVNVTPDSFYDGGKNNSITTILQQCEKHLVEGAKILDIGGQSTRPGATQVGTAEEIKRVTPALASIHKEFPHAILSIDTYHAQVAKAAVQHGTTMINDISSGSIDPEMLPHVIEWNLPYIASHIQGTPADMQNNPMYQKVTDEVISELQNVKAKLTNGGFNNLLVDPGFGFGKSMEHNFELLNNLDQFKQLEVPLLVGLSRKSMIWKTLNTSPEKAMNGTTSLNTIALLKGADILRVHDVKEAVEAVKLISKLRG